MFGWVYIELTEHLLHWWKTYILLQISLLDFISLVCHWCLGISLWCVYSWNCFIHPLWIISCKLMSFISFGKFLVIAFINISPLSLFSPSEILIRHMLEIFICFIFLNIFIYIHLLISLRWWCFLQLSPCPLILCLVIFK